MVYDDQYKINVERRIAIPSTLVLHQMKTKLIKVLEIKSIDLHRMKTRKLRLRGLLERERKQ